MKVGDKIRIKNYRYGSVTDYVVEEFRYCLGVFEDEDCRKAGRFTPLCDLYENGCDSKSDYIANYGQYFTHQVQAWMDLPSEEQPHKEKEVL